MNTCGSVKGFAGPHFLIKFNIL
ncbi:hypothetical protein RCCS2_02770 [Roseobacter sp. CCS2]|nr:hypothetical protein RCCS2_02770 [Roseobacter sp. CCS2]